MAFDSHLEILWPENFWLPTFLRRFLLQVPWDKALGFDEKPAYKKLEVHCLVIKRTQNSGRRSNKHERFWPLAGPDFMLDARPD